MLPLILDSRSFSNNPLISNLPPITTTSAGQYILPNQWLRISFTTGSSSSQYLLSSVSLRSVQIRSSLDLFVQLYTNDGGTLGTKITDFINPSSIPTSTSNNLFILGTPLLLSANTTYWLVAGISINGSGEYLWAFTNSTIESGIAGWSINDNPFYSGNGGLSWQNNFSPSFNTFQFSINGETW